jgi:hypothetical protein
MFCSGSGSGCGLGRCSSVVDCELGHHGGHLGIHIVVVARLEHGAPDGSKLVLVPLVRSGLGRGLGSGTGVYRSTLSAQSAALSICAE